jgi:hypothetical protein
MRTFFYTILIAFILSQSLYAQSDTESYFERIKKANKNNYSIAAQEFPIENSKFYKDGKLWLAINPNKNNEAVTSTTFLFKSGKYDVILIGVGENDGGSSYKLSINDKIIINYQAPISIEMFEEGKDYIAVAKKIIVKNGDKITVQSSIGSKDGKEYARARWAGIVFAPKGKSDKIINMNSSFTAK